MIMHDFSSFDLPADVYADGIGAVENLGENFRTVLFVAAAVRATLALEQMNQESHAQPMRRINTGGIVIVLGDSHALPAGTVASMPMIEHAPALEIEVSDE